MRIIQDDEFAARMAGQWLGVTFAPPLIGLLVLDDERKIPVGAVVLNNYSARNIDLSAIGVGCWSVPVVRELARYVFGKLRCRRITAMTRDGNAKAIRALRAMGFAFEGYANDWFEDGEAAVRYGLTASRQQFIRTL